LFVEGVGLTLNDLALLVQKKKNTGLPVYFAHLPIKRFAENIKSFCGKLLSVVPQLHLQKRLRFSVPVFSAR